MSTDARYYDNHPTKKERMRAQQRAWHRAHRELRDRHEDEWHRLYLENLNRELHGQQVGVA